MIKRLENKIRMYKAVWLVLQKFNSLWKDNLGFKEIVDKFDVNIKAIDTISLSSEEDITGVTTDKEQMNEDLIDTIMEISGPFFTMADQAGDHELATKVYYTDSQLENMTDPELVTAGKSLASLATKNAEGLKKYGILAADITGLETLAENYDQITAGSRKAVTGRSTSKKELATLLGDTSRLLKKNMDKMVDSYRRKSTEFTTEYYSSRKIIPYGERHEAKDSTTTTATTK